MTGLDPPPSPDESTHSELLDHRYLLGELIGRGGMGAVHRGLDTRLDRPVAVKLLVDARGADEVRFHQEVRTLARFVHPHLVRVLDAGEANGRHFLVMDLVDGPSLARRFGEGRLSLPEAARIGVGVARALAYVHRDGVVHRDVKPANILLDASGEAHLADFGIARLIDTTGLTVVGVTLGTPAYLAPEQLRGETVGPAADVYALGLVLLEGLSGERAFIGTSSEVAAARLVRGPAIPPALPFAWRELLALMTAREPQARPSASVVAQHLTDLERGHAGDSRPVPDQWEDTVVLSGVHDGVTERLEASAATASAPTARRRVGASVVGGLLGVVALITGLALGGVFAASPARLTRTRTPSTASTASSATASATSSATSTTTSTTTTTTYPAPSVANSAGSLVAAVERGVTEGNIAPQAGQQLVAQLQPLLFSPRDSADPQRIQPFDQLVQTFYQDVANRQIDGRPTIRSLMSTLRALAVAVGTSLPTPTTIPTAPEPPNGPPGGPPHGHGQRDHKVPKGHEYG